MQALHTDDVPWTWAKFSNAFFIVDFFVLSNQMIWYEFFVSKTCAHDTNTCRERQAKNSFRSWNNFLRFHPFKIIQRSVTINHILIVIHQYCSMRTEVYTITLEVSKCKHLINTKQIYSKIYEITKKINKYEKIIGRQNINVERVFFCYLFQLFGWKNDFSNWEQQKICHNFSRTSH